MAKRKTKSKGSADVKGFALAAQEPKAKAKRASGRRAAARPAAAATSDEPAQAYQHEATRKNNPPAGLVDYDRPPAQPRKSYAYDPHLDPQLTWAGKAEHTSFEVDTVSLHIHERVSTQAIMRAVKREDAQRSLFGGTDLPESKAIDFYAHEVGWANRLVLGDSLLVMNSLLEREQLAGKVQCIYMDPPYGVKFNSNFQPSISRRDVKDGDDGSLTREPEQIQAYRDTWTLGVHSYLTYLRDRLLLARELLHESGSVFVQISDENIHHVRELLDEVFGPTNSCGVVTLTKAATQSSALMASVNDYLLWYARDRERVKYRKLYRPRPKVDDPEERYICVETLEGEVVDLSLKQKLGLDPVPAGRWLRLITMTSQTGSETSRFKYQFGGKDFSPPGASALPRADRSEILR